MHPGDGRGCIGVFDAVAGGGVVFHHFACAAAAPGVYLVEDGVEGFGDSDAVFFDEGVDGGFIEECQEEGDEVAAGTGADGAGDNVFGDGAGLLGGLNGTGIEYPVGL